MGQMPWEKEKPLSSPSGPEHVREVPLDPQELRREDPSILSLDLVLLRIVRRAEHLGEIGM